MLCHDSTEQCCNPYGSWKKWLMKLMIPFHHLYINIHRNQTFIDSISWFWSLALNIRIIAFQDLTCPLHNIHNHFNQKPIFLCANYRHLIQGLYIIPNLNPHSCPKKRKRYKYVQVIGPCFLSSLFFRPKKCCRFHDGPFLGTCNLRSDPTTDSWRHLCCNVGLLESGLTGWWGNPKGAPLRKT